jgi:dTDP-4-amino-4,6-dideoxygalactose transaminase
MKIPFNKPVLVGKELFYIAQSVLSGHCSGDGPFTKKCNALLEARFSAKKVLLTTSCTSALEMAAILCKTGAEDEVIIPSFTFVSTANAFYLRGAKPVFIDIREDTLNLDHEKLDSLITNHTKVVVPVHYAGIGCDMEKIVKKCRSKNIYIVEDAAQGVNAQYNNRFLGTLGDIGCYSFHETKNYSCGEGGAIVLNNPIFFERAEIVREKGTNRSKFFRGEVDKYTWVDIGSSYLPSDLLAAYLFAQLEHMDEITEKRKDIFENYFGSLLAFEEKGLLRLPKIPPETKPNYHVFYILLNSEPERNALMDHLKANGVQAVFHYLPLHLSKIGQELGYKKGDFPVTETMSARLLRLPFYYELLPEDQNVVISLIQKFFQNKAK